MHISAQEVSGSAMLMEGVSCWYGEKHIVRNVSLPIRRNTVTAIMGPSGCGKSTLLRCLNRMNETVTGFRFDGTITLDGENIYDHSMAVELLRARVGMVFQKPNPFPKSIYDNVAYGPRIHGLASGKADMDVLVERSLNRAGLWDEVKDRLGDGGTALSGGQQQRLCIARAIAVGPEVLLMDEPCSALDPQATSTIEQLIAELKDRYTVVIVTHNKDQAARVSDRIAFMYCGELIEFGDTAQIMVSPQSDLAREYVTGRFS